MDVARSDVVRSCAGRDSGQLFFVVELDESYVYLADGKGRRVEKPKRKKRKHVELLPRRDSVSLTRFAAATRYSTANYEGNWPFMARKTVKTKGVN